MSGDFYNSNNNIIGGVNCSSVSPSCSTSRWITEDVFKLIEMVQLDEAIYNPRHKFYFCRPYVENFWREVDNKLEKNPGSSLAKWTNLRISFRREYTNYLEEKIPPCWTYFDRMFFLHPFLRKKQHVQAKYLDTQLQDALVQFSTISQRFQRERCLATTTNVPSSVITGDGSSGPQTQHSDSYFEYFDETEHNNSELEDITDDEQQGQFLLQNDIKSECEDVDEYEVEQSAKSEESAVSFKATNNDVEVSTKTPALRLQHLNRIQSRHYHDEWRAKRPCSQENGNLNGRGGCSSAHSHANISFVRPTFNKNAHSEVASSTTSSAVVSDLHAAPSGIQSSSQHGASSLIPSVAATVELCDCKTDPDAMFLMSLLPDIQKLNGRDRGKIKIAFQNILQDYLYPD